MQLLLHDIRSRFVAALHARRADTHYSLPRQRQIDNNCTQPESRQMRISVGRLQRSLHGRACATLKVAARTAMKGLTGSDYDTYSRIF
eukprot:6214465-Pleurochrysis_carterae.AAC.1